MGRTTSRPLLCLMLALAVAAGLPRSAHAQWQTQTEGDRAGQPALSPSMPAPILSPPPELRPAAPAIVPPNTTVVPRSTQEPRHRPPPPPALAADSSRLPPCSPRTGRASSRASSGACSPPGPVPTASLGSSPPTARRARVLKLDPGEYLVNVAFGRANLTRKVTVSAERAVQERFVLNAGGLRLTPVLARGEAVNERAFVYDIYSDERDQYGQRTKVMGAVRPGVVLRLNAGIYNVVGTYGDANAIVRADVTVEAGKLTEATISHAAAKVTFKLVARPGGDAIADTQWTVVTDAGRDRQGERRRAAHAHLRARHLRGERQERRRRVPAPLHRAGRRRRPGRGAAPLTRQKRRRQLPSPVRPLNPLYPPSRWPRRGLPHRFAAC